MTVLKSVQIGLVLAASATSMACAGCDVSGATGKTAASGPAEAETLVVTDASPGKPAAPISFSYKLPGDVIAPGEVVSVEVKINADYASGQLTLTANADEGLSLMPGSEARNFQLDLQAPLSWTISFKAEKEGVHYVNILAEVDGPAGLEARSYAIAVPVGENAQRKSAAGVTVSRSPEGEPIVQMDAIETTDK